MYILEGTIGAGKSTFLKLLSQAFAEIAVKLEPVDAWQSHQAGASLLHHFYEQPKRWAYTFETFTMIKRIHEHLQEKNDESLVVVERSIYSGHYVFARNSYENGFMTNLEWNLYREWFEFLTGKCPVPQGFIYLKVDPVVAFERIKKRNRSAEETLPLNYLYQLDKQHERFLCNKEDVLSILRDVPVLILDCSEEFEQNQTQFAEQSTKIKEFMGIVY